MVSVCHCLELEVGTPCQFQHYTLVGLCCGVVQFRMISAKSFYNITVKTLSLNGVTDLADAQI